MKLIAFIQNSNKYMIILYLCMIWSWPLAALCINKQYSSLYFSLSIILYIILIITRVMLPKFLLKFKIQKLKPGDLCVVKLYGLHEYVILYNKYTQKHYTLRENNNIIFLILEKAIIKNNFNVHRITTFDELYKNCSRIKVLYKDKIFWIDPRFLERLN